MSSAMNIVTEFERNVLDSFRFLTSDFDYQFDGISAHLPEIAARFHNQTTEVAVLFEVGSPPWVELADRQKRTSPRFSLELLLEERKPDDFAYSCDGAEPGTEAFRTCLEAKATALQTVAADVLRGDFTVLPKMEARLKENEARRTRELFGDSKGTTDR